MVETLLFSNINFYSKSCIYYNLLCFIDSDLATSQSQNLRDTTLGSEYLREKIIDQTLTRLYNF